MKKSTEAQAQAAARAQKACLKARQEAVRQASPEELQRLGIEALEELRDALTAAPERRDRQ